MRPGSLTRQYTDPKPHAGAYRQIHYTRRMKSRTEYVRRDWVTELRRQFVTHKRFKRLVDTPVRRVRGQAGVSTRDTLASPQSQPGVSQNFFTRSPGDGRGH